MRILVVSLFLPTYKAKHAGGKFVFELVKNLSSRHEIYLATRFEEKEISEIEALRPYCKDIYPFPYSSKERRDLPEVVKLVLNYLLFSRYAGRIARKGQFDIIQVEWTETALLLGNVCVPMVLDAHDVITKPIEREIRGRRGFGQHFYRFIYLLVRATETAIARRFDMVFTRSEYDREYLLAMTPGTRVEVVPHPCGLDMTGKLFEVRPNTILFLASYKYRRVNVDAAFWFYREVFPLVRREFPDACFIIAGYGPPEELTTLAERDPQVEVPGFVDDIERCYKEAAVFVAPILTGGGIIVKILDALAAGRPVVTTSYGNEGIAAQPGRDLLVADVPDLFAAHVVWLLRNPGEAQRLAESGHAFVNKNYGLEAVIGRIEAAYEEIATGAPGRARKKSC